MSRKVFHVLFFHPCSVVTERR